MIEIGSSGCSNAKQRDGNNWYSYVQHDSVNLRDFLGLAPWNLYSSIKEARDDFGINYNDDSMNSGNGVEFGTTIYQDSISHNYYYSLPNIGDAVSGDSVWLLTDSLSPNDIIVELSLPMETSLAILSTCQILGRVLNLI